MDDGELDVSDHHGLLVAHPDSSASVDFLDELLKGSRTCTHTHTCNPPGPDAAHTHTCFHTHTHTQVFPTEEEEEDRIEATKTSRRPLGNREAVRKYREKKKAHTAYLEEEVKKLKALNQQLVRKLQGQAVLEAEVLRLRSLLLDIRGKIDCELGSYPFQKQCLAVNVNPKEGEGNGCGMQPIGVRCNSDSPRFHPHLGSLSGARIDESGKLLVSWEDQNCQPPVLDCLVHGNEVTRTETQVEQ